MAEATKAKGTSTLLIVGLIILLIGGGFGLWMFLKPKSTKEELESTEEDALTGRMDVSDQNPGLTAEQIQFLFGNSDNSFTNPNSGGGSNDSNNENNNTTPPLFIKSFDAQQLISAKAERMQANEGIMDIIRAKYDIGRTLIDFNSDAQGAIDSMFSKVAGVNISSNPSKRYLTYPIYRTHEPRGATARSELQNILNLDIKGFTLSNARHGGEPWWVPSVQVNLLIGTDKQATWSADKIWWFKADRADVDWYKAMNGQWKGDRILLERKLNGEPKYWATNMRTFVQRWVEAIDRLDLVTEWEAIRTLSAPAAQGGDGWAFTYIDPTTGVDYSNTFNPQDPNTNDSTDALLIP